MESWQPVARENIGDEDSSMDTIIIGSLRLSYHIAGYGLICCLTGSGPSALVLSYILHGHIPYYDSETNGPHPDPILHSKLSKLSNGELFEVLRSPAKYDSTTEHFRGSGGRMSYSEDALPVNVLLDTLLRPNAATCMGETRTRLRWEYQPQRAVPHMVIGCHDKTGGQWAVDNEDSNAYIGTLSYGEGLSLPGYSFAEHFRTTYLKDLSDCTRPTRRQVSDYYAAYPAAVGIEDSIFSNVEVSSLTRTANGFKLSATPLSSASCVDLIGCEMQCRHIVLATGIFTKHMMPPELLSPILSFDAKDPDGPVLVIGSGFSAADVILSTPPTQKIIHIFKWDPENRPSPLRACHRAAYPEYAAMFKQMKAAASVRDGAGAQASVLRTAAKKAVKADSRDWLTTYEGLPNAEIVAVDDSGKLSIKLASGASITRQISHAEYVVGRRGSLSYLSDALQNEIVDPAFYTTARGIEPPVVSGRTLRRKTERDLEVAPGVFVIGSLTGDSLVMFAFGGCAYAAARIMGDSPETKYETTPTCRPKMAMAVRRYSVGVHGTQHADLHVDRRKLGRLDSVKEAVSCNDNMAMPASIATPSEQRNKKWECVVS
jgi:hypothetical protein